MMDPALAPLDDPEEQRRAEAIVSALEERLHRDCSGCGGPVCGHQYVANVALGFRQAPQCLRCLAEGLKQDSALFLARTLDYVKQRACFRSAWLWASEREGTEPMVSVEISCLRAFASASLASGSPAAGSSPEATETGRDAGVEPAAAWDAGNLSCGDLVLELRLRLRRLEPGQILELTAHDPAAPVDLPAWCRLTGHDLVRADAPVFWIRRKEE